MNDRNIHLVLLGGALALALLQLPRAPVAAGMDLAALVAAAALLASEKERVEVQACAPDSYGCRFGALLYATNGGE